LTVETPHRISPPMKGLCLVILLMPVLACGCAYPQALIPPGEDPDALTAAIRCKGQGLVAGSPLPPEPQQDLLTKCVLMAGEGCALCVAVPCCIAFLLAKAYVGAHSGSVSP